MTPCLYISIMPTRRSRLKGGMHAPSSHWLSQIFTTRLSTPSAVSKIFFQSRLLTTFFLRRRKPSLHRWRMWLGLYAIQRITQTIYCTRRTLETNNWGWVSGNHGVCSSLGGSNWCTVAQFRQVCYRRFSRFQSLMQFRQLRFKERNWICWFEKPRGHVLHELPFAVPLLHQLLSQGEYALCHESICLIFLSRLYIKYPQKTIHQLKVLL